MSFDRLPKQERSIGPVLLGAGLLVLVAGACVHVVRPDLTRSIADEVWAALSPSPPAPHDDAAGPPAPVAPAGGSVAAALRSAELARTADTVKTPPAPSFDIVRVTPDGHAVVAGRAAPGAMVTLRDGQQDVSVATADRNGEFVMVPPESLPPGNRELTLSARSPSGAVARSEESVVVLVVPPQTARVSGAEPAVPSPAPVPTTVLLPGGSAPPRVLQAPSSPAPLALRSVDYSDAGEIRFAGSAHPTAPLRVYVDNAPVGETRTSEQGEWTLTPPVPVAPGVHRLRVDELGADGAVKTRVELPFLRTPMAIPADAAGHAVVQPGQSLWRIAQATYGSGRRYTVIYQANKEQIRNPNLIYPGQVFAVPGAGR